MDTLQSSVSYMRADGPVETSVARAASIGEQSVTVSVVASFSLTALAVGTPASATGGK